MKTFNSLFLVLTLVLITSCIKAPDIINPVSVELTKNDLSDIININLSDYDKMVVSNKQGALLPDYNLKEIKIGNTIGGVFTAVNSFFPTYIKNGQNYFINFSLSMDISNPKLITAFFTLRFIFNDNSWIDVDTCIVTFKFPYSSTNVILTNEIISTDNSIVIQDIELANGKLYFITLGPTRFFEYDIKSRGLTELPGFAAADNIAGNSDYMFVDSQHRFISRYNINENKFDMLFTMSVFSNPDIRGLDVAGNKLYVLLTEDTNPDKPILAKFDLNCNLLEKKEFPVKSIYLAVDDSNILYSVDYDNNNLIRYDLNSNALLDPIPFPAKDIEGLCVNNNYLYFVDQGRKIVSFVDCDELIN